jgi:hypothetical protein
MMAALHHPEGAMLTIADAREVIDEVLVRYGHVLPVGLEAKIRAAGADKIFHILKQSNYAPNFGAYFRSWFAATNINSCALPPDVVRRRRAMTANEAWALEYEGEETEVCGPAEDLLKGIATNALPPPPFAPDATNLNLRSAKSPIVPKKAPTGWKPKVTDLGAPAPGRPDVYSEFGCPAFCAPAVDPMQRNIYVNQDATITIGTLYHEFIHFLSHGNFYPEFYAQAGRSAIVVEGVTEYLTRAISPLVKQDRADGYKYDSQLMDVTLKAGGDSTKTLVAFQNLAFKGDLSMITTLGGTVPRLPKSS